MTSTADAPRRLRRDILVAQRWPLSGAIGASAVRYLAVLSVPWALQRGVDDGLVGADPSALLRWAVVIAALGVVDFVALGAWTYWGALAEMRALARLRGALVVALLRRPETGSTTGAGDLVLRAGRDVGLVGTWVVGLPGWAVMVTTAVVLVPGLWSLDPTLLLVAVLTLPALAVIAAVFPRKLAPRAEALARAHAARADVVDAVVRGASSLRGIGATREMRRRHGAASAALTRRSVRVTDLDARWGSLTEGVPALAVGVGVCAGVGAAIDGRLSPGGIVAFATWMGSLNIVVHVWLTRVRQVVESNVGLGRLVELLGPDGLRGLEVPEAAEPSASEVAALVAQGVRTPAPAAPIDLVASRGGFVAITGPVGVGKSTLLRVLAGQIEPSDGHVTAHGSDGVHPRVHLVPQRPLVLAATVRDNLTLRRWDSSTDVDERLRRALADVGLDSELPDLDHVIADGSLSGGQVQRLALARALVDDAPIILLDDVTSAVDEVTQERVVESLLREAQRRIVVVGTHRTALLTAADTVVTLEAAQ